MPDLTPDATTTPNFDPGRVAIVSGWLVYDVGHHTCGGYGAESGYTHEPGCGLEGIVEVAALPDLLAAATELTHVREARDNARAEVERLTEAARALHQPAGRHNFCGTCAYAPWPCATYRALCATPETGGES